MKALKDDMDGVLIFVCACFFSVQPKVQPCLTLFLSQGWFILWCSHRVRRATASEFASKPRSPVGLLPESIRPDA
jgi:hypothetical protein